MPAQYFYRIPLASDPARLIIGTVCLVFALAIFASWLPRAIRWLGGLPGRSAGQRVAIMTLALIPVAIGLVPATVLVALIKNPMTYVSDEGLTKESFLLATPTTLKFTDIARVSCGAGRGPGIRWFTLVATDGRKMGVGNPGSSDFNALHVLLEDRLGFSAMQGCARAVRRSR